MRAFSLDLRQRVLDAALRGDRTERAVADAFGVSLGFVQKLKRRSSRAPAAPPLQSRTGGGHTPRSPLATSLRSPPTSATPPTPPMRSGERG